MPARPALTQPVPADYRFPFDPYPKSWYVLLRSDALKPGQVTHGKWCGEELVVYRTTAGEVCIIDAHCPHLGAHFGFGGRVEGEELVCPFHDFRFNTAGECTGTPYGKALPKKACVKHRPALERNGLIWMWWHPEGLAPEFEIPEAPQEGWTGLRTTTWTLKSHPQETNENVADLGHLGVVHGYRKLEVTSPFTPEGALLKASYKAVRPTEVAGMTLGEIPFEFDAIAAGLGCGYVEARLGELGISSRHFVFCTPVDGTVVQLMVGNQLKLPADLGQIHPLLRLVPRGLLLPIACAETMRQYEHDVQQDWDIWERKVYVHPPRLAEGDGPIGPFRAWCRQFYDYGPAEGALGDSAAAR
jgi:nitrite reductase/ring-hydroxylating ferredoxin subunit